MSVYKVTCLLLFGLLLFIILPLSRQIGECDVFKQPRNIKIIPSMTLYRVDKMLNVISSSVANSNCMM